MDLEGIKIVTAIIVAGGKGKRLGLGINKQYIRIGDREVLARTLEVFQNLCDIDEIVLVCPEDEIDYCMENIVSKYGVSKVVKIIAGGAERHNSVRNGLDNCNPKTKIVVIHDGARPFVSQDIIKHSIEAAMEYGASTAAIPVKDTIKKVSSDGFSIETPKREELYAVQTPQSFNFELIMEAHRRLESMDVIPTDDTMLVEMLGKDVKVIEGSNMNIKITTREDLIFAEGILKNL